MDVDFWMRNFLKSVGTLIEEDGEETLPTTMTPVTLDDFNSYLTPYVGDKAILALLLDYDGTLSPIAKHPDLAILPPETKKVLERLANRPDVFIAIVSGRSVEDVKKKVGIEGITYAGKKRKNWLKNEIKHFHIFLGNHGLEIHHSDGTRFVHPMPNDSNIGVLKEALKAAVCHDGAWIEDKGQLLTFHYRNVPKELWSKMVEKARKIITDHGYKVSPKTSRF